MYGCLRLSFLHVCHCVSPFESVSVCPSLVNRERKGEKKKEFEGKKGERERDRGRGREGRERERWGRERKRERERKKERKREKKKEREGVGREGARERQRQTERGGNRESPMQDERDCLLFVGWLLNVPATGYCISGTDLLRQVHVLPH